MFDENETFNAKSPLDIFVDNGKKDLELKGEMTREMTASEFTPILQVAITDGIKANPNAGNTKIEDVTLSIGGGAKNTVASVNFEIKEAPIVKNTHVSMLIINGPQVGSILMTELKGSNLAKTVLLKTIIKADSADSDVKKFFRGKFGEGTEVSLQLLPGDHFSPEKHLGEGKIRVGVTDPNWKPVPEVVRSLQPEPTRTFSSPAKDQLQDESEFLSHDSLADETPDWLKRDPWKESEKALNDAFADAIKDIDSENLEGQDPELEAPPKPPARDESADEKPHWLRQFEESGSDDLGDLTREQGEQYLADADLDNPLGESKEKAAESWADFLKGEMDRYREADILFNELTEKSNQLIHVDKLIHTYKELEPDDQKRRELAMKVMEEIQSIFDSAYGKEGLFGEAFGWPDDPKTRLQVIQLSGLLVEGGKQHFNLPWGSEFTANRVYGEMEAVLRGLNEKPKMDKATFLEAYRNGGQALPTSENSFSDNGGVLGGTDQFELIDENEVRKNWEERERAKASTRPNLMSDTLEQIDGPKKPNPSQEIQQQFMEERETIHLSGLADQYDHTDFQSLVARKESLEGDEEDRLLLYEEIRQIVRFRVGDNGLMPNYFMNRGKDNEWDEAREKLIDTTLSYYSNSGSGSMSFMMWFTENGKKFGVVSDKNLTTFFEDININNPWASNENQVIFQPRASIIEDDTQSQAVLRKFFKEAKPAPSTPLLIPGVEVVPPVSTLNTKPGGLLEETLPVFEEPKEPARPKPEVERKKEPENITAYRVASNRLRDALSNYEEATKQLAGHRPEAWIRTPLSKQFPVQDSTELRAENNEKWLVLAIREYQSAFRGLPSNIRKKGQPLPKSQVINPGTWLNLMREFDSLLPVLPEKDKVKFVEPVMKEEVKQAVPLSVPTADASTPVLSVQKVDTLSSVANVEEIKKPEISQAELEAVNAWIKSYESRTPNLRNYYDLIYELTKDSQLVYVFFDIRRKSSSEKGMELFSFHIEGGKVMVGGVSDVSNPDTTKKEIEQDIVDRCKRGEYQSFRILTWNEKDPNKKDIKTIEELISGLKSLES